MAVSKIKIVNIIGRMEELDAVTAICGRSGEMHPENTLSFYSNPEKFRLHRAGEKDDIAVLVILAQLLKAFLRKASETDLYEFTVPNSV